MAEGQGWTKRNSIPIAELVLIIVTSIIAIVYWLGSTTVVLIVRHAERNNAASCNPPEVDPPLSEAGQIRAQASTRVAGEARISAIYASEYCRTQQTVQPLATLLSLPITVIDQDTPDGSPDIDALITHLWANNRGKVVLISGHTHTIPPIIEKLGGGTIPPINEREFDNLYVVAVPWWGETKVVRLKYGAP